MSFPIDPSNPVLIPAAITAAPKLPLRHIPRIFSISPSSQLPHFSCPIRYHTLLTNLKAWAPLEGLRPGPDVIGTHSLHRGISSDWALIGVPDRLRYSHGRWRSAQVADGYIDESIDIRLHLAAIQCANHIVQPTRSTLAPSPPLIHQLAPSINLSTSNQSQNRNAQRHSSRTSRPPSRFDA